MAVVLLLAGCQQPWYAKESSPASIAEAGDRLAADPRQGSRQSDSLHDRAPGSSGTDPFEGAAAAPAAEQEMLDLLAELQNADDIDSITRQELIADLRAADPAHWPLIVQQLRSTLAYRRQLAQMEAGSAAGDMGPGTSEDIAPAVTPAAATLVSVSDDLPPDTAAGPKPTESSDIAEDDIGSAFAADAADAPASAPPSSGNADTAAAVPTPLPEPEPAEASLAAATQAPVRDTTAPPPFDPEPTEVVAAAYQEPIYQTTGNAASDADPRSDDEAATADLPWDQLLERAIVRLEEETSAAPATTGEIARHARLRLLHLAAENDTAALAPIEGVPPNQQDFWAKQLFGLSTFLDDVAQPDLRQRAALSQRHLQNATDLLGEMGVLEVRNLAFCTEIRGFGVYEPLEQPRFRVGEQVKLYAEVANYRSEPTEKGFRTVLATSYEVLDESDRRVDSGEFPQVEDVCRARRRDFHIQYGVSLPTRIYPGKYRLQLTIEDMLSRKLGRSSVEFEIVDDPAKTL